VHRKNRPSTEVDRGRERTLTGKPETGQNTSEEVVSDGGSDELKQVGGDKGGRQRGEGREGRSPKSASKRDLRDQVWSRT